MIRNLILILCFSQLFSVRAWGYEFMGCDWDLPEGYVQDESGDSVWLKKWTSYIQFSTDENTDFSFFENSVTLAGVEYSSSSYELVSYKSSSGYKGYFLYSELKGVSDRELSKFTIENESFDGVIYAIGIEEEMADAFIRQCFTIESRKVESLDNYLSN